MNIRKEAKRQADECEATLQELGTTSEGPDTASLRYALIDALMHFSKAAQTGHAQDYVLGQNIIISYV